MHSFAPILRRIVARVGSTFFLWLSSAANATNRSLGGMQCHRDHRKGDNEVSSGLLSPA